MGLFVWSALEAAGEEEEIPVAIAFEDFGQSVRNTRRDRSVGDVQRSPPMKQREAFSAQKVSRFPLGLRTRIGDQQAAHGRDIDKNKQRICDRT
jgi:hypothetical protein